MHRPPIPRQTRCNVYRRDRFRCRYCGRRVTYRTGTLDHVIPFYEYGPSVEWNLVTACFACNSAKGCRTLDTLGWHLLPCGMSRILAESFEIALPVHPLRYTRARRKQHPKRRAA